jgi:glycosyltransferase 2 family protein
VTRAVRSSLLAFGLSVAGFLVWRAGPRFVWTMLRRTSWSFVPFIIVYAVHLTVRAVALWRTMLDGRVRFADVLRIGLAGEAVEMLTFTGPFLAEPAKGWLLARRGMATADAFAAVVTEYLLYTVTSSWLALVALWLLLTRGAPARVQSAIVVVIALTVAFLAAFAFATISGIGLIVPLLRGSRVLIGRRRSDHAVQAFSRVEDAIIRFLHEHRARLTEVLAIETAAHLLLVLEIWIVLVALGAADSWKQAFVLEGGVKFVPIAFGFIPGQLGALEGVYALLAGALGLPPAVGLTLALLRRVRDLMAAGAGLGVLALWGDE